MGDSLENTVRSIMNQINENFEVLVIDDASSDNTKEVLNKLLKLYPLLRYESLLRDPNRKLGYTRNYSIEKAEGEWCIFHIDADDTIGPHLRDFISAVEMLDRGFKTDKLYAGKQIHMARKSFLLSKGPFRNIYRGEDRDFYERLIPRKEWILIEHKRFIFRTTRPTNKLFKKMLLDLIDQTETDIRKSQNLYSFIVDTWNSKTRIGIKQILFKFGIMPYAYIRSNSLGKLEPAEITIEEYVSYRNSNTKTMDEWCSVLSLSYPEALNSEIFTQ